jgi:hypothetical protein
VARIKEERRPIRIVLAEVTAPDLMPLSERLARALLPVALRQRMGGVAPGPAHNAERVVANRDACPPRSPPLP